ncbi:hypothetical protein DFH11DRAFT_1236761 [Phellopilus nigrolimitatus]|nr:hypothetical protein DFH11DRAFT_1236761 [Phellopilus nigrolimitatus]
MHSCSPMLCFLILHLFFRNPVPLISNELIITKLPAASAVLPSSAWSRHRVELRVLQTYGTVYYSNTVVLLILILAVDPCWHK